MKVGVLAGGISREREISLLSGKQVFSFLKEKNIKTIFIDLKYSDEEKIKDIIKKEKIEVAFVALHGFFGEDGQVQHILENISLPYTGSGPQASRLAMDKAASKEKFQSCNLLTPAYKLFFSLNDIGQKINFPAVIKPSYSGSSLGVSVVKKKENLIKAVKTAFSFGDAVVAEDYIEGKELTVGILEEKALAVVEIIPQKGFFDFNNKYKKGNSQFIIPAKLDVKTYKQVQEAALAAHNCLGCCGFSRVDLRLKGNLPYVLEVNSIPGLTAQSLLPLSALACGISFKELIIVILKSALKKVKELK